MLKKRIIPIQLLIDGRLVKTVNFDKYRDVGDPVASSRVYNSQYADELILLNINRGGRTVEPLLRVVEGISEVCFMPLSLGGGVNSLKDAELLIKYGADKVILNSVCYTDKSVIEKITSKFGSQAAVVSIDVRRHGSGFQLYADCGRRQEAASLQDHIRECTRRGAGEILINSIDQDGTMSGFDLPLIREVMAHCTLPVIASGGAGTFSHLKDAFLETGVSALACGSLFNFGDNNPIRAKAFLTNHGLPFKKV